MCLEMSNVQLSSMALERLVARRTFPLHRRTSVCRNLFGAVDHDELSRDMKATLREVAERDQQRWNFDFDANKPLDGDYKWEEVPVDRAPAFYLDRDQAVQSDRSRAPATPVKGASSADSSVLPEGPRMDVQERLALPDGSGGSSGGSSDGGSPAEVNQENRAVKLNSGKATHRLSPCVRRKRTGSDNSGNTTHITGKAKCFHNGLRLCFYLTPTVLIFKAERTPLLGLASKCCFCLSVTVVSSDYFVKRKRTADRKSSHASPCHHSKSPITVEHTPRKRIR